MGLYARLFSILSLLTLSASAVAATDLDWASAKRRYETQQVEADRAKARLDQYATYYHQVESRLYSALQTEKQAESELEDANYQLRQTNSQIQSLEQSLPGIQSQIYDLERDRSKAQDTLRNLNYDLDRARREVEHLEGDLDRVGHELDDEKGKPTPDASKIAQLESERERLQERLRTAQDSCDRIARDVRDCQSRLARIDSDIRDCNLSIQNTQNQISQLNRRRDDLLRLVDNCSSALRRAQDDVRQAQADLNSAKQEYAMRDADYRREAALAQQLYSYYETVLANYRRERDKVIALAEATSREHGGKEASERAPSVASADGMAKAAVEGNQIGASEGARRDEARGYRDGRASASTLTAFVAAYQYGIRSGTLTADSKASKEDFPRGYNDALAEALAVVPSHEVTLDLSSEVSPPPGEDGRQISAAPKTVGSEAAPAFGLPVDPPYKVPVASDPVISIPAQDNRYYAPPCQGLILAEFEPLCRDTYEANYKASWLSGYRVVYRANYVAAFNANVKGYYDASLALTNAEARTRGLTAGVTDQGILDGFAARLPIARAQMYASGRKTLTDLVASGYLALGRGVALVETTGDGLFTPGEKAKLSLTLDNLGGKRIPAGALRLRTSVAKGIGSLPAEPTLLPALEGQTRTTLLGVVSGVLTGQYAGQNVALTAVLEMQDGMGGFLKIAEFTGSQVTHFPVELEAITLAKKPKVGEAVASTFRYRNLTRDATPEVKAKLSTSPAIVETPATPVIIPPMAPSEAVEVPVSLKPGVWVGENTEVKFLSHLEGLDPAITAVDQPFGKVIQVERDASMLLYDSAGKPLPESAVEVAAGGRVNVLVQFKYQSTKTQAGPFAMRVAKFSDPGLKSSSDTTIGVDYGYMGPSSQPTPIRFSFDADKSMKGKQGWVLIALTQGAANIHVIQLLINVK